MILRPYQADCKQAILANLGKHKSTLVEMATGLGKTVIFASVADEWPGRVLVVAHRDELIRQAADKIHQITGHPVAVEMGMNKASDSLYGTKVTVASVQTLARANRRERFHPDHFSLVVIDEGHHAAAITYREVMEYFKSAKRLLVTATPKRADKIGLGHVCESVAYQYGIEPAIDDGWLVPVRQSIVKVEGLDFSRARTVAKDFNQQDLEKILTQEKQLHAMVASSFELIGNRQALWFCASVLHAEQMAMVLKRYAGDSAVQFLSGASHKEDRRDAVNYYKSGKIQHLLNCALFLEGFDAPTTSVIVMARPTKSTGLYMQVLGRGTRPLPGVVDGIEHPEQRRQAIASSVKPDMQVIDFCGNAGKHKIVQAIDVLGGKHDPKEREYARETMEDEGRTVDINEAIIRAREELALMEEESKLRKEITAKASFKTHEVSPFTREYQPAHRSAMGEPCTKKQAGYICYLSRINGRPWSFDKAISLTKKQARGVIDKLKRGAM